MDTVLHAAQCAKRAGVPVLLNAALVAAALPEASWPLIDRLVVNEIEAGALAAGMREGLALDAAVALGQAASAVCVTRRGAQPSIPTRRGLGVAVDGTP